VAEVRRDEGAEEAASRVRLVVKDADVALPKVLEILNGADVRSVDFPKPSFDEGFFRLVERDERDGLFEDEPRTHHFWECRRGNRSSHGSSMKVAHLVYYCLLTFPAPLTSLLTVGSPMYSTDPLPLTFASSLSLTLTMADPDP